MNRAKIQTFALPKIKRFSLENLLRGHDPSEGLEVALHQLGQHGGRGLLHFPSSRPRRRRNRLACSSVSLR